MHIAKTAGSTINAFITQHYSKDDYVTHFETLNINSFGTLQNKKFISGHTFYPMACKRMPFLSSFIKITVFRRPINQLMSHIAWIRNLAEPGNEESYHSHAKHFQNMADRFKQMDLSSPRELRTFVNNLNPQEQTTFNNFQTRYLFPEPTEKVADVDFIGISRILDSFDLIGTSETVSDFLRKLEKLMHWQSSDLVAPQNVAKNYFGMDPQDPAQMDALHPLIAHDCRLYDMVYARTSA